MSYKMFGLDMNHLQGINTLAYLTSSSVTKKCFHDIDCWGQCCKTFLFVTDKDAKYARALGLSKSFRPSPILAIKARAYLYGALLKFRLICYTKCLHQI
jgi:hypothetical protein